MSVPILVKDIGINLFIMLYINGKCKIHLGVYTKFIYQGVYLSRIWFFSMELTIIMRIANDDSCVVFLNHFRGKLLKFI